MQTFLPYPSFERTAKSLDMRRLGKQRVEALQILNSLHGQSGWTNHPAVKMWSGHIDALVEYGLAICEEWIRRGYNDTCFDKIICLLTDEFEGFETIQYPLWLGSQKFHRSHKSNLIRKLPEHYHPMWPEVPNDLPYVWPIR